LAAITANEGPSEKLRLSNFANDAENKASERKCKMSDPTEVSDNIRKVNDAHTLEMLVTEAAKVMGLALDQMWTALEELGINKNDPERGLFILRSGSISVDDVKDTFVKAGVKILPFKAGWAVLTPKAIATVPPNRTLEKLVETMRSVDQYSDEELLAKYSPDCPANIMEQLRIRSKNRPFVVFDDEKGEDVVDIQTTKKLLSIARRQDTPSTFLVDRPDGMKKLVRPCAVGEFPTVWFEECPVHPDVILVDGYCEKCQQSWKGISIEDRVLVRIAVTIGAICCSNYANVDHWIKRIRTEGIACLMNIPAVALRYKELKEENNLPTLRKKLSTTKTGKSDPFFPHKTY
jgi:hypothetical protein